MTHYRTYKDHEIKFDVGCNHPQMKNNNTESIGCNGQCHECKHCQVTMSFADFKTIWDN